MNSYEGLKYQPRAENRWRLKSKVLLTLGILGFISAAISGYTIFDRNRYIPPPSATTTNTTARKDLTPAFTPTPMHPFPSDVSACRYIPPDQQYIYTEPYQGGRRVRGGKIYEYLVGKPSGGTFQVLYPGQLLPADFDSQKDQFWFCRRNFGQIPASPTP